MRKVLNIFVFCILAIAGLSIGLYSVFVSPNVQASGGGRLGVEITTNQKDCVLFLPANLKEDAGLQATIPIKDGGDVTAVRVKPVMQNGEVAFSVTYLTGSYDKVSKINLREADNREVLRQSVANGQSLAVKDYRSKTSWEIQVKAVSLSAELTADLMTEGSGPCGCGRCKQLSVCPSSCECLDTTCGSVCCIPTGGCP